MLKEKMSIDVFDEIKVRINAQIIIERSGHTEKSVTLYDLAATKPGKAQWIYARLRET